MRHHEFTRRHLLQGAAATATLAALGVTAWSPARAQDAEAASREVVEMTLGDPEAPVTMIEYASLTCPHCATFHREVFPRLKADYIDEGLVHFVSREVFFDRPGLWGAMIARCAGEDRYFGVIDLLYAQQATWSRATDAPTIVEHLYGIGRQAGLTRETMDACLTDADFAQALVAEYQRNATADGIESTPTFVINGERFRNMPWEELEGHIQAALPD
jgi:protein-disulfide isomerase